MIDGEKTEFLRKKIQEIKQSTDGSAEPKKEGFIVNILLFLTRFFAVYGAHYFVLRKMGTPPFNLWEFFVVFYGFLTIAIFLKKYK